MLQVPFTALCAGLVLTFLLSAAALGAPAPAPGTGAGATPADTAAGAEAAARHAKRTVCLKQAKAKKLLGAARNSFVKDCVAAH